MNLKKLVSSILFYVSVPKCVYCGERLERDDRGLCAECLIKYREHKKRDCSRCSRVLSECTCSSYYLASHGIRKMIKLFRYNASEQAGPSNYLIYSLKQDNREDVISFLSDELSAAIKGNLNLQKGDYIITNVPRRRASILKFGFDHSRVLAQRVAKNLSIEYMDLLVSRSKRAQKSVARDERIKNVEFDYKSRAEISLKGKTVILIDDIVTSGASMSVAALLLRGMGCRCIIGASLGIAYRDSYTQHLKSYIRN